jgi:hypothetical protein
MAKPSEKEGPASFFLREEIGRNVARRRGCCLSEASFTPFRYKPLDFSKKKCSLDLLFLLGQAKRKSQLQNNNLRYSNLPRNYNPAKINSFRKSASAIRICIPC